ncbi:MAG TPA: transglycosylase [Pseudorhodoplanes sp.]|nr:transglycosylase [Pseudorhodoplanes sp.]
MRINPALAFFIVIAIGIVAGVIFDRLAGPGWLSRQITGPMRGIVTSSLVGIAGSFIGFHLAALLAISAAGGFVPFVLAALGAALVLWLWRIMR